MEYDYDEERVQRAGLFAVGAHLAIGQKRKGCDTDYHVHPLEVAEILRRHGCSFKQQAAGHLHDVVEDTQVTLDKIEFWFGKDVARMVGGVTKITRPEDGCREVRHKIEVAHLKQQDAETQDVKLADCISNMRSCHLLPVKFRRRWLDEKADLIPELTKARYSLQLEARQELRRQLDALEKEPA